MSQSDFQSLPPRGPELSCVQFLLGIDEAPADDEFVAVVRRRTAAAVAAAATHGIVHGPGIPGSLMIADIAVVPTGRGRRDKGDGFDAEMVGTHGFVCSLGGGSGSGGGDGLVWVVVGFVACVVGTLEERGVSRQLIVEFPFDNDNRGPTLVLVPKAKACSYLRNAASTATTLGCSVCNPSIHSLSLISHLFPQSVFL